MNTNAIAPPVIRVGQAKLDQQATDALGCARGGPSGDRTALQRQRVLDGIGTARHSTAHRPAARLDNPSGVRAMRSHEQGLRLVSPARVSFLAIYNPTLVNGGPAGVDSDAGARAHGEATLDNQIVFYYAYEDHDEQAGGLAGTRREQDAANERLRRVGLAQGMVAFARNFSESSDIDHVETATGRLVLRELEPNWWALAHRRPAVHRVHTPQFAAAYRPQAARNPVQRNALRVQALKAAGMAAPDPEAADSAAKPVAPADAPAEAAPMASPGAADQPSLATFPPTPAAAATAAADEASASPHASTQANNHVRQSSDPTAGQATRRHHIRKKSAPAGRVSIDASAQAQARTGGQVGGGDSTSRLSSMSHSPAASASGSTSGTGTTSERSGRRTASHHHHHGGHGHHVHVVAHPARPGMRRNFSTPLFRHQRNVSAAAGKKSVLGLAQPLARTKSHDRPGSSSSALGGGGNVGFQLSADSTDDESEWEDNVSGTTSPASTRQSSFVNRAATAATHHAGADGDEPRQAAHGPALELQRQNMNHLLNPGGYTPGARSPLAQIQTQAPPQSQLPAGSDRSTQQEADHLQPPEQRPQQQQGDSQRQADLPRTPATPTTPTADHPRLLYNRKAPPSVSSMSISAHAPLASAQPLSPMPTATFSRASAGTPKGGGGVPAGAAAELSSAAASATGHGASSSVENGVSRFLTDGGSRGGGAAASSIATDTSGSPTALHLRTPGEGRGAATLKSPASRYRMTDLASRTQADPPRE
ncbi:hypothetical protein KEM52_001706 [Ascosphaera acerosa]|nr:hypothetical protein KEM52_001706 [Ascosphaera acerosa]